MERIRKRDWFNPTKGHEGKLLAKLWGEAVKEPDASYFPCLNTLSAWR